MEESNKLILKQYSSELVEQKVFRKLDNKSKIIKRKKAILFSLNARIAYAFSFLLIFLIGFFWFGEDNSDLKNEKNTFVDRVKGVVNENNHNSRLMIYRKNNDDVDLLTKGSLLKASDLIQLAYFSRKDSYGVIFSVDSKGLISLHYPISEKNSSKLIIRKKTFLSRAFELDDTPGFEKFYFISSNREINVSILIKNVKNILKIKNLSDESKLKLEEDLNQYSMIFNKGVKK